jgi:KipI family sensor histidine kinase inhibitor
MRPIYFQISPVLGELQWGESASDALLAIQLGWTDMIQSDLHEQIHELRVGFTSVSINWKSPAAQTLFQSKLARFEVKPKELSGRIWQIPVCYGSDYGKDLGSLALARRLTVNQLIQLHSSVTYRIHFYGFLPGFLYLSGLDVKLHHPRKAVPERAVPEGSVAIGGGQTGIYPKESPAGWHVIGRTPVSFFDLEKDPPVWALPGDRLEFLPITSAEMEKLIENRPNPKLK